MVGFDRIVLGEELMVTVAALRRLVRRRRRQTVDEPPLRGAQGELLQVVENQPGVGIAAAARALHLAANSVSTLVNQLIDMEMLVRDIAPGDRRAARLWLTETATERLALWRQVSAELLADALGELATADRQAIADALPALRTLLIVLDAEEKR
jgi:DNA-binding MarR family transcriptional regulator